MLLCPECKIEYREGYTNCADCGSVLLELTDLPEEHKEYKLFNNNFRIRILMIFGLIIILFSPMLSYKFTSSFFMPNGTGQYNSPEFKWMIGASHSSFLIIGLIFCLPLLLNWIKNFKK